MKVQPTKPADPQTFPTIKEDLLDRLSQEAAERTLQPQEVDWKEIHRQAAIARQKA